METVGRGSEAQKSKCTSYKWKLSFWLVCHDVTDVLVLSWDERLSEKWLREITPNSKAAGSSVHFSFSRQWQSNWRSWLYFLNFISIFKNFILGVFHNCIQWDVTIYSLHFSPDPLQYVPPSNIPLLFFFKKLKLTPSLVIHAWVWGQIPENEQLTRDTAPKKNDSSPSSS